MYFFFLAILEREAENMGVGTKKRKGMTAVVLLATPCTKSLGCESGGLTRVTEAPGCACVHGRICAHLVQTRPDRRHVEGRKYCLHSSELTSNPMGGNQKIKVNLENFVAIAVRKPVKRGIYMRKRIQFRELGSL